MSNWSLWEFYCRNFVPLIMENYRKREIGLLPDEWFWADMVGVNWGFYCGHDGLPGRFKELFL